MGLRSSVCLGLLLAGTAIPPPVQRVAVAHGSVLAPAGSVSRRTGGSVDVLLGELQISRPPLRVAFSAGMIEPLPNGPRAPGYRWIRQERTPGGLLTYGERKLHGHRLVEANIGRASFAMVVRSDQDLQLLLSIVRTYLPGPVTSAIRFVLR